jgi:bacteriocin-like protein
MKQFETIDESELNHVAGGLSFNLGLDTGLKIESSLGSISIPSPITVATDLIGSLSGKVGELLTKVGTKLGQLGQLFDFS